MGYPVCVYCPDPKYSEEARKAKYQGTVILQAVITADGRVTEVQIVKGPGLGLEEKAVEAVKDWRLKPAMGPNGKPVPFVLVPLEINLPPALVWPISQPSRAKLSCSVHRIIRRKHPIASRIRSQIFPAGVHFGGIFIENTFAP